MTQWVICGWVHSEMDGSSITPESSLCGGCCCENSCRQTDIFFLWANAYQYSLCVRPDVMAMPAISALGAWGRRITSLRPAWALPCFAQDRRANTEASKPTEPTVSPEAVVQVRFMHEAAASFQGLSCSLLSSPTFPSQFQFVCLRLCVLYHSNDHRHHY